MFNYALSGSFDPVLFHFVNDTLHILTVLCCYIFLLLLTKNSPYAFLTSLLFAIHPCHSQPINGISARGLLMAGLLSFLSLIFYMLSENRFHGKYSETDDTQAKSANVYYLLSIICFFLGIYKSIFFTLIVIEWVNI